MSLNVDIHLLYYNVIIHFKSDLADRSTMQTAVKHLPVADFSLRFKQDLRDKVIKETDFLPRIQCLCKILNPAPVLHLNDTGQFPLLTHHRLYCHLGK